MTARIASIAYVLGEETRSYRDAPGFDARCHEFGLPQMPDLFGWGRYRRTQGPLLDLAVASARATLDDSRLAPAEIDAVILCSANLQSDRSLLHHRLLRELDLTRALPIGVGWTDCATLLTSLALAQDLVRSRFANVLVVSANRIEDESYRFQPYALFSDGAASCLVSSTGSGGFEIVDSEASSRWQCATAEADDTILYREVHRRLMNRLALGNDAFDRVLPNNLFLPVLKIKEASVGVTSAQLFMENTSRIGHCFAADSLINLHDHAIARPGREGERLLLTANAEGVRCEMALRRLG